MPYLIHEITALISLNRTDEAKQKILATLREARMHKGECAKRLGCAFWTLSRWIEQLNLRQEIDSITKRAKKEGWHHTKRGGRPVGSTVANGAARRNTRVNPV